MTHVGEKKAVDIGGGCCYLLAEDLSTQPTRQRCCWHRVSFGFACMWRESRVPIPRQFVSFSTKKKQPLTIFLGNFSLTLHVTRSRRWSLNCTRHGTSCAFPFSLSPGLLRLES